MDRMLRICFLTIAAIDAAMVAALLVISPEGSDPAGEGMQLGLAVFGLIALAGLVALYHYVRNLWVRVPVLLVLALPIVIMISIFLPLL